MRHLRFALFGIVLGVLLSSTRGHAGHDLLNTPIATPEWRLGWRVAALALVAVLVGSARLLERRIDVGALLFWTALGVALHGLLVPWPWVPQSGVAQGLRSALIVGLAAWIARAAPRAPRDEAEPPAPVSPPTPTEALGISVAAAGATVALAVVGRYLQHLGTAQPEDDATFLAVFLLSAALGAAAFGTPLARPRWASVLLPAGLAASAALALQGFAFLADIRGADTLGRALATVNGFFARFGLDVLVPNEMFQGTLPYIGVLAAQALLLTAFGVGTALSGALDRARLARVAIGAAAGLVVTHFAWERFGGAYDAAGAREAATGWSILTVACAASAAGALLALWRGSAGPVARAVGTVVALVAAVAPHVVDSRTPALYSPWARVAVRPTLIVESGDGILTVEPWIDGTPTATLDRRRLTSIPAESDLESHQLQASMALARAKAGEGREPRVLYVGQMDPQRSNLLDFLGADELDYTAPWYPHDGTLLDALFGPDQRPIGEHVSPATARERFERGHYDLVLVPTIHGPVISSELAPVRSPWAPAAPPRTGHWGAPSRTVVVCWLDGSGDFASETSAPGVVVRASIPGELGVGLVYGDAGDRGPTVHPLGSRLSPRIALRPVLGLLRTFGLVDADQKAGTLLRRWPMRLDDARTRTARRLERSSGDDAGDLFRGLAQHYGAQRKDNPWATPVMRVNIDRDALASLAAAASAGVDPTFTDSLLEDLSKVLVAKKRPEEIHEFLAPLLEQRGRWPALEWAVANMWLEFTELEEARAVLERLAQAEPHNVEVLTTLADVLFELELWREAAEQYDRARDLRPDSRALDRPYAVALFRSGDPAGRELLEELLLEDPEDEELLAILGTVGPPIPPPGDG